MNMETSIWRQWTLERLAVLFLFWSTIMLRLIGKSVCTPAHRSCPVGRYPSTDGRCFLCFAHCGRQGCTGPGRHIGEGGCNSCFLAQHSNSTTNTLECISRHTGCRDSHYISSLGLQSRSELRTRAVCRPCHTECVTCFGSRQSQCLQCRNFRLEEFCVEECPGGSIINMRQKTCTFISDFTRDRIMRRYRELLSYSTPS